MNSDFQSRILYTQKTSASVNEEEPVIVSSTIYAIRFMYPGATQHTTSRIRITCTYRDTDQFEAHAGVIERWSDKGWILMDDYTDDVLAFHSEEEFRKRLLDYSQSFIMGIPLATIDKGYIPDVISSMKTSNTKQKRLYTFKTKETTKTEKTKEKTPDSYNTDSSKKDDEDDDDLDWL